MLITADEAGVVSEDVREWAILRRRAKLQKLQRKLAEDDEFEGPQHIPLAEEAGLEGAFASSHVASGGQEHRVDANQ